MLISPPPGPGDDRERRADRLPMRLAGDDVVRPLRSTVHAAEPQYAVLVVSESQLDSLMGRPAMRQVHPRLLPAGRGRGGARRWPWLAAAATAFLTLGALAGAWLSAPTGRILTWTRPPVAPPLLTGAGFSVAVATPRGAEAAGSLLGRLQDLGLPGFAEPAGASAHQVLVGPYASLDEAESVQRRLARAGFPGPRLSVDDELRRAPPDRGGAIPGETGVLLVGGGGRVSLVFELAMTPRQVIAQQATDTLLDVDIAPVAPGIVAREWSAPPGVILVEHVSIEEGAGIDGDRSLRARLTIPRSARAGARVEGRRVYVDLTWPEVVTAASRPRGGAARETAVAARAAPAPAPAARAAGLEPLRSALVRFGEIAPFVLSAAAAPSPEVLVALDGTLASLAETLRGMRVSGAAASSHRLLVSAVTSARRAVDPLESGDRQAHAHQAVGLFEAAKSSY